MDISLQPIYDLLNQFLLLLLLGLVTWLVKAAASWLKAHAKFLDTKTASALVDALDKVLINGIIFAQGQLNVQERSWPTMKVNNLIAQIASQYAIDHAQELVEQITGGDAQVLTEKILARLPKASPVQVVAAVGVVAGVGAGAGIAPEASKP